MTSDHFSLYGIVQQLFVPTQSFPPIAIPFFVMAAELMMNGTLGRNLIDFATDLVLGAFAAAMRRSVCWARRCSAACPARRSPMRRRSAAC